MARTEFNLRRMNVNELLELRDGVSAALAQKSKELQHQLQRLGVSSLSGNRARRAHPSMGVKVAPKYRGPNGETWAGRGATPNWLAALMKQGQKPDDFLIAKPGKGQYAAVEIDNYRERQIVPFPTSSSRCD